MRLVVPVSPFMLQIFSVANIENLCVDRDLWLTECYTFYNFFSVHNTYTSNTTYHRLLQAPHEWISVTAMHVRNITKARMKESKQKTKQKRMMSAKSEQNIPVFYRTFNKYMQATG